jgi:hypothetical protein
MGNIREIKPEAITYLDKIIISTNKIIAGATSITALALSDHHRVDTEKVELFYQYIDSNFINLYGLMEKLDRENIYK